MDPTGEIKPPVKVEQKPTTISQLKQKSGEVVKKVMPEQTRTWLLKAAQHLQKGEARGALQDLSQPPSTIPLETIKKTEKYEASTKTSNIEQVETITQEHLTKYAEERKALGLREERTLQEIAQEKDKQRKEATDSYLSYRKSEKNTEKPPKFEDILQQGREKAKAVRDMLSIREKAEIAIKRTKALAIMTAKGIRNPERVLQILEAESGNNSELSYINLEDMRKNDSRSTYEREKAIRAFHWIYERAQSNEFINGCRKIGNVLTVWERMQKMGTRLSLNNIGKLDTEQLILMLQKLAKIPSKQFSTTLNDLHQYSFLFPDRSYNVQEDFKPLVEFIASNTQISAEQRQVLETAKRIYQILEPGEYYGHRDFHPILSKHDPSLLFSNRERLFDELIVLEQLALDLYDPREKADNNLDKSHWKQKYLYNENKYLSSQINKLAQIGDLHTLSKLIRNGFSIGADQAWVFVNEYQGDKNALQENIRRSAELLTQFSDKTLLSEVLLIEDLRQSEYPWYKPLSIERSRLFESLARERSSCQNTLQVAMNIVNKLTDDPLKKAHLLNGSVLLDENLGISLNINYLLLELKSPDVLDKFPQEDQSFWRQIFDWREHKFQWLEGPNDFILSFFIQNQSKFNEFYQEGRLTDTFFNEFTSFFARIPDKYFTDYNINKTHATSLINRFLLDREQAPASIKGLAEAFTTLDSYELQSIYEILGTDYNKWSSLVTDGKPNVNLISLVLENPQKVNIANKLLTDDVIAQFPETEQVFWRGWRNLPDRLKIIFYQKLDNNPQITENLAKEMKIFNTLFEEIEESPSQELKKIKDQLISQLLENSQPEQIFRKIRALFERNNLPDFAKKFKIFEILYCTQEVDGKTRFDREMEEKGEKLSPILRKASRLRRLDTIYKDLLRINIDSGDISLRNYLAAMREGQVLLIKVDSEGIESLTPEEKIKLTRVLNRVNVLYENSLLARIRVKSATPLSDDISLEARITSLKKDLQIKENQTIIDRVFEVFVKPLGYESIDAVLDRMDSIKEQAHKRNLSNPRVQEGQLEINAGDLLKGIQDDVLGYILQNGSIAREYIGVNADSDHTPFDTDTAMVLQEDLESDSHHVINSSPAKQYGNIIILVRDRGQFIRTDQQEVVNLQYNPQKYELFYSGLITERHYGVRTGLPSTEIDAIILTEPLLDENQDLTLRKEQIFFNIANNGFYIPVVNPEGKVIFTEEDYNRYRLDDQRIREAINQEKFSPSEFIDILKESPYLKKLYEMSSGVGEGYSTEKHTQMVMNQFEKYFSGNFKSTFLTRDDFRLMLSLHDIGKPLGVYATGSTSAQHEYTKRVLTYALQATGIPPQKVDTIMCLVDQDILGEYFKGQINSQNSATQINTLAETIGVSPKELVNTLKVFYICDAGSYTTDAGGQASLDSLFVFDHNDGNNRVSFSDEIETKYQELLRRLV